MILRGDHCQCAACLEYFNSTYAFDRHRIGKHGINRSCRTAKQMDKLGWRKTATGFWMTPRMGVLAVIGDSRSGDRARPH